MKNITVLNGSISGFDGNTELFTKKLIDMLKKKFNVYEISLKKIYDVNDLFSILKNTHGYIFTTGTYWDSWGSPLQRFFEQATEWEGTDIWLGKPAATIVTMHSVGGKEILSRLQGVLSTLGCLIPPMCGMVYSLVNHLALQNKRSEFHDDFWCSDDLYTIAHNFLEALNGNNDWKSWSIDKSDPSRKWFS